MTLDDHRTFVDDRPAGWPPGTATGRCSRATCTSPTATRSTGCTAATGSSRSPGSSTRRETAVRRHRPLLAGRDHRPRDEAQPRGAPLHAPDGRLPVRRHRPPARPTAGRSSTTSRARHGLDGRTRTARTPPRRRPLAARHPARRRPGSGPKQLDAATSGRPRLDHRRRQRRHRPSANDLDGTTTSAPRRSRLPATVGAAVVPLLLRPHRDVVARRLVPRLGRDGGWDPHAGRRGARRRRTTTTPPGGRCGFR